MATSAKDFLQQNPNYIGYANTANRTKPAQAPKPKKGSGNQSWLSSIISELGGAGGATGGAAIGAALGAPIGGIGAIPGGILGGLIGGAAGGFGGRVAENKVRDNRLGIGDALKEGAISGAFGAGSAAFQGARGAYAAGKAAGFGGEGLVNTLKAGSGVIDDALLAAEKVGGKSAARQFGKTLIGSGAKTGKAIGQGVSNVDDVAYAAQKGLQAAGGSMRNWQRGIVGGNNGLTRAEKLSQGRAVDAANKWFSGIGKSTQYENVDDAMKALTNTYKVSSEGARKFGSNAKVVTDGFLQNIENNPLTRNLTPKQSKLVSSLTEDVANKIKTEADFVEYMSKRVNPLYKELKNGNPGSINTQIYEAFRQAGKTAIDENMATRSGINKQFANLLGASTQIGKTVTRDQGEQASRMGISQALSTVLGPTVDVLGRGAQQAGKVTKYTTPVIRGAVTRGLVNGGSQPQDPTQDPSLDPIQQEQDTTLYGANVMQGMGDPMQDPTQQMEGQQMPQQSAYSLEQAMADLQAHPDAKSRKNIMDYYKFVQDAEKAQNTASGAGGPNITKVTGQQYVLASRGANAVSELEQLLSSNPSVLNKTATPGRKLPGVGGFISNMAGTGNFDAIGYNVANALLRLETGAQANPEEIKNLQAQMMPRAGDSQQTVQIKLAQLRQAFSAFLNTANGQDTLAGQMESYQPTQQGLEQWVQ